MANDSISTIARSATHFFSGTMLSRITGMLRDMAMAYAFGTSSSVAAFFVAFRFANFFRRLLGEGALQTAFVPYFEKVKNENPKKAAHFFFDLTILLTLTLTVISVLVILGIAFYLYFGHPNEDNKQILYLTALLQPCLIFLCLYGLFSSFLQCHKNYFTPSAAPIIMNIVWIFGALALINAPTEKAMPYLAFILILACFGQFLFTYPATKKIFSEFKLERPWKNKKLFSEEVKKLFIPLILGITGVAAEQVNSTIDPIFARYADLEGPALLWYAIRLQQLPLALFGIAIAGALLPPLSRAIKNNDILNYQKFLFFGLEKTLALMVPITGILFVFGFSIITLLYGHGGFTDNSITGTTHCLWGYCFGLTPMTLILVLAPAFYSQNQYKTTTFSSIMAVVINIILNTVFIMFLDLGAASVALATSLSAWFNMLYLAIALNKKIQINIFKNLSIDFMKIVLATTCAGLCVIFSREYLALNFYLSLAIEGSIFITTLLLSSFFLKINNIFNLLSVKKSF